MRGTMLWFNVDKDRGVITGEDGEKVDVLGTAFVSGERPESRCAGTVVEFDLVGSDGGPQAAEVTLIPHVAPRRARLRHRG